MNVLITAGNTLVLIDKVRCLTNVFTGRTGATIAQAAYERGHKVRLLTSHPEALADLNKPGAGLPIERYRTFDDLRQSLANATTTGGFDAIVHCAAVSDYLTAGVYSPSPGTTFEPTDQGLRVAVSAEGPGFIDRAAGKVKSDEPELWIRLTRAPKLVDLIRSDWRFGGLLVKFKLEVGVSDERLLEIAERSRRHSHADLMVANTLEEAGNWAFLGPLDGDGYRKVARQDLAERLITTLEQLHQERGHG